MTRTIAFKTLGCRLNQSETEAVASEFADAGYTIVDFHRQADAYVVNTCTVTGMSDHKSRNLIRQVRRSNPEAVLVVTGCMVSHPKEEFQDREGITYIVGNNLKSSIFPLLDAHFRGEVFDLQGSPGDIFGFKPARQTFHSRSFIKVQDGCDSFCSFCIVPFVRGRAKSRPANDILSNILRVLDFGFREVVLTGVNIGRYNDSGTDFTSLIGKILVLPGDFRLRLSSLEPEGFGEELFDLFLHPRMTPHLHLCLQSGSDHVLSIMKRRYRLDEFRQMIDSLRTRIPGFNFTTDILVGFPGETVEDFAQTCRVVEEIGFSHIHTFKYSPRLGTLACKMPDQVPEKVKNMRSVAIREIARRNKLRYRLSLVGKNQKVLVERISGDGMASGYGEHYVPVTFQANAHTRVREFRDVLITGLGEGDDPSLSGSIIRL
jgi:threonylcarbamoyladenosine tRNA methylthiotransferase MtaB